MENNQEINYGLYVKSVLKDNPNVRVYFFYLTHRLRSPHNIIDLKRIIKRARAFLPNLYYISATMHPNVTMMYRLMLPKRRVVIACHNVSTPRGANSEKLAKKLTNMWIRSFKNIRYFQEVRRLASDEKDYMYFCQ